MLDPVPLPPLTNDKIHPHRHAPTSPTIGKKDNKDECTLDLIGPEKDYWNDTETARIKPYLFPDTCASGDDSNHEATKTMGVFFCTLEELHWDRRDPHVPDKIERHNSRYCVGVDRGKEDASSNRVEHVSLLLCLRKIQQTQDLIYLTDNESLLKTIRKWVCEGTRSNLTTTPDAQG